MPGRKPGMRKIKAKIAELEMLAENADGTLSPGNSRMLDFLRNMEAFEGRDQWIAIVPQGAIRIGDERPVGTVKCVPAQVAADLLAFADMRGHKIRLATAAEAQSQQQYEDAITRMSRQRIADSQAELARQTMAAFLGQGIPGGSVAGAVQPSDVPVPPTAAFEAGQAHEVEVSIPTAPDAPAVDARLAGIGTPAQVEKLSVAGWTDVDRIAKAGPDELAKAVGMSKATAAQLIAAASEAVAASQDAA